MSTLTYPIKLNPTTITIPRSLPSSSYALKLGLTPHLLIQEPLTSSCSIRRSGDTLFEVTVPVGGVIELEIEVDREGLGRIGGMEMSIMQEIELEETIKSNIMNSLRQVCWHKVGTDARMPPNWLLKTSGPVEIRRPTSFDQSLRVPIVPAPMPL